MRVSFDRGIDRETSAYIVQVTLNGTTISKLVPMAGTSDADLDHYEALLLARLLTDHLREDVVDDDFVAEAPAEDEFTVRWTTGPVVAAW